MKKAYKYIAMTAILITFFSVTTSYAQAEKFPPIQKYLDKIEGKKFEENSSDIQMISQLITVNDCTVINKDIDSKNVDKMIYTNIDWINFRKVEVYSLKNANKYAKCRFYFYEDITYTAFDENGEQVFTGKEDSFSCFIYMKDREVVLEIIEDWKKHRN